MRSNGNTDNQTITVLLFALANLSSVSEYKDTSLLLYLLDKKSFVKICKYFGGSCLRIPTLDEVECVTKALSMYEYVNLRGLTMKEFKENHLVETDDLILINSAYKEICQVLNGMEFNFDFG